MNDIEPLPSNETLTIDQALQQAIICHQAGQWQEAERFYRAILQAQPKHADANHNLGVLAVQMKQPAVALPHFMTALEADPTSSQYWISCINALIQAGQNESARQMLQSARQHGLQGGRLEELALRLGGDSARTQQVSKGLRSDYRNLKTSGGKSRNKLAKSAKLSRKAAPCQKKPPCTQEMNVLLALFNGRQYTEAAVLAQSITERFPLHEFGWKILGAVFNKMGRIEEALPFMQKVVMLSPCDAEAHYNLGVVLHAMNRLKEAEASYRHALRFNSNYVQAHCNLGAILQGLGRLDEAEASYHCALQCDPNFSNAHSNLGITLNNMGRLDEAEASFRKALNIKPDHVEAYNNLGNALKEQGRLVEAQASYRQALEVKPDCVDAYSNLGNLLKDQGKLNEAEISYRRALEIKSDSANAYSNLLYLYSYHALVDPAEYLAQARGWEQACVPTQERHAAHDRIFHNPQLASRRLKVGYVSGDYRQHAVSYFIEQLFSHHDRTRIELFAYSTQGKRDEITERLQALVEHWVSLTGMHDTAARERIEANGIDVLIDLSGHTSHNRMGVFARRAAPVQAHYLGFMASTGLTEMDYWIGDGILTPPETDNHFSEQVWRLPRVWVSYEGKADAPATNWQPNRDGTVWLGSFNNLGKLTSATLALWAKVLRALPEGKLLLKTKELTDVCNRQRILDAMSEHGIAPERIKLKDTSVTPGWQEHMAYYDRLDIALDPIGAMGGGTTTCDALWMGVPVIALEGDRMASRMTASMLDAIGHPEWIARTEAEYIDKVLGLVRDVERRKALRPGQRDRMAASTLCDAKGLAMRLEDAYADMFGRWINERIQSG